MKKFLSLLASVGLVATASTSVVSCTKKADIPTYHSIGDIKSWSFTSDDEIIPSAYLAKGNEDKAKALIIATVANKFSNPEIFSGTANNFQLKINPNPSSVVKDSNGDISSATYLAQFIQKGAVANNDLSSASFTIKVDSMRQEMTNKFKFNGGNKFELDLSKPNNNYIYTTLRMVGEELNRNSSNLDNAIELEKNSAVMISFDNWMYQQLSSRLVETLFYVPGIDAKGVRFKSIDQQIRMSYDTSKSITQQMDDGLKVFNTKIVEFNEAILKNIAQQIKDHTWDSQALDATKIINNTELGILNDTPYGAPFATK